MLRLPIQRVLLMSVCVSALPGCASWSKAVAPIPSATVLALCKDPDLVPDPDKATAEQINDERLSVARAYADCRELNREKAEYIKGTGGK